MTEPSPQPVFEVEGNRLRLLDTGADRFGALIALIDGAQASLRILYYTFADDEAGRRVRDALIAAAERGVRVRLIVDGFGSGETDRSFFDPLDAAGVATCVFHPSKGRRYLLRNHQKLAVADGEGAGCKAVVGGFNVEADYFEEVGEQGWRDLGVTIEGPVAGRITGYFDALHDWIEDDHARLRHVNRALTRWSEQEGRLRWLIGGPTKRLSPWARALRREMRGAKRIDILVAYFSPSPTILRGLGRAARHGERVRIVTAAKSDSNATIAAARFTYAGLLRRGVRIFEYQPTKLHMKLYIVDDAVFIGSANFDMRSLFINLELMLRIEDEAFAAHVRGVVDREMIACSREVTADLYRAKTGPIQRIKQFGAYVALAVLDPSVSRGLNFGIDE